MISNGKENSPPFIALKAGADVWLGNSRGSPASLNHFTYDWERNSDKYWDFTFTEMGKYDLPAVFDYITQMTGFQKIAYVGHSMGTTQMFVNLSLEEEYNLSSKTSLFVAMVPAVYLDTMNGPGMTFLIYGINLVTSIVDLLGLKY